MTTPEIGRHFGFTRQALNRHVGILEDAVDRSTGLIARGVRSAASTSRGAAITSAVCYTPATGRAGAASQAGEHR